MKKKTGIIISPILAVILLLWPLLGFPQHDLTLYSMDYAPQRIYLNPAFIPEQHGYVGIPFLSGIRMAMANPFSYNNALKRDAASDSLNFEASNLVNKISKNDHITFFTSLDILSVGTKIAKDRFYLNFGIRERVSQNLYLPKNLFYLLWYGNAAPQVFGKQLNISPALNASVYDEWSVTFSGYALKRKLTWGATLKYLSGRINVTTKKSQFDFYTNPSTYNIMLRSDFEVETSGINDIGSYFNQRWPSLLFPGNNGFAIDLGATYTINDKFSVNASALDLGFINWRSRTLTFVSHDPGKEFTYSGMPLDEFVGLFTDFSKFGTTIFDSLTHNIHVDSVYGTKYRANLPAVFNVGGTYMPNDRNQINLVLHGISWNHHLYPAISCSYLFKWTRYLGLSLSYNVFNRQYTNVGGGICISAGPIQLYLVSDNLPGLVFYKSTNNTSFQFGINVLLKGKTKTVDALAQNQLLSANSKP